jgi:hypothetical protein
VGRGKSRKSKKRGGRTAGMGGKEQERTTGLFAGQHGLQRDRSRVKEQNGLARIFRVMRGQEAKKAGLVFEPVRMVMEGPYEKKEDKANG